VLPFSLCYLVCSKYCFLELLLFLIVVYLVTVRNNKFSLTAIHNLYTHNLYTHILFKI